MDPSEDAEAWLAEPGAAGGAGDGQAGPGEAGAPHGATGQPQASAAAPTSTDTPQTQPKPPPPSAPTTSPTMIPSAFKPHPPKGYPDCGIALRWPSVPRCGLPTASGRPCGQARLKGAAACRLHGGRKARKGRSGRHRPTAGQATADACQAGLAGMQPGISKGLTQFREPSTSPLGVLAEPSQSPRRVLTEDSLRTLVRLAPEGKGMGMEGRERGEAATLSERQGQPGALDGQGASHSDLGDHILKDLRQKGSRNSGLEASGPGSYGDQPGGRAWPGGAGQGGGGGPGRAGRGGEPETPPGASESLDPTPPSAALPFRGPASQAGHGVALAKAATPPGLSGEGMPLGEKKRYTEGNTRLSMAIAAAGERLDQVDLRAELAALQALAGQLVRGLNPQVYRAQMRHVAACLERRAVKAKPSEGEQMGVEEAAAWLRAKLEDRECHPEAFVVLVREIRATAKVLLDMEVVMRRTLPAERVRRSVQEIMTVVRRRVDRETMIGIAEDLKELRARGSVV